MKFGGVWSLLGEESNFGISWVKFYCQETPRLSQPMKWSSIVLNGKFDKSCDLRHRPVKTVGCITYIVLVQM